MLGEDDDVFDSVTWESPSAPTTYDAGPSISGPGFRQSTDDGEPGHGPHDPKWEGYLITNVKDPVKELADTKDAYVSYLVTAKVGHCRISMLYALTGHGRRPTYQYSQLRTLRHADGSRTLSSYEPILQRTFQHA